MRKGRSKCGSLDKASLSISAVRPPSDDPVVPKVALGDETKISHSGIARNGKIGPASHFRPLGKVEGLLLDAWRPLARAKEKMGIDVRQKDAQEIALDDRSIEEHSSPKSCRAAHLTLIGRDQIAEISH
jgi:hypothetical protein